MTNGKKKSAARKQPAKAGKGADRQLTCFVVTGFGNKTDYSTGRVLNLDKTYEQLIRPACDEVNVNCFRAIEMQTEGKPDKKPDVFLAQRLALVTYKEGEKRDADGNIDVHPKGQSAAGQVRRPCQLRPRQHDPSKRGRDLSGVD